MRLRSVLMLSIVFLSAQTYAADKEVLKDQRDKVSYSIGANIGSGMKKQSIDINPEAMALGLKDAFSGSKTLMTEQEMRDTLTVFQREMMAKQMEHTKMLGDKNKKEGDAFLAENKKKEGVITLPSGLQYKVIKEGDGDIPKASDMVSTNYRGTLIDGTEFDSSYRRGQPVSFPVGGVILGWKEALQLMKVGSKWQLFVPSNLAYGERGGPGGEIGPNSALIFDIELLSIEKEKAGGGGEDVSSPHVNKEEIKPAEVK